MPDPDESSSTPSPTAGQKLNSTPQIIEYHGDSTVWGYMSHTDGFRVSTPAPAAFASELPSYHTVRNMGVNSTTACGLLNGQGYGHDWATQMRQSNATVVIINHGINDVNHYGAGQYRECLSQLIDTARNHGKVVILETPNPADDGRGGELIGSFVRAMRETAAQKDVNLIDQHRYLREQWGGDNPYAICPDGIHPSEQIYIEKGKFAAQQFRAFDRR